MIDKTQKMNLKEIPVNEKYHTITRNMFLSGEASLCGNRFIQAIDTIMLKTFGLLFAFGEKAGDIESKYYRLTGNFKRIGNIAREFTFLGPFNRLLMWLIMKNTVNMLGQATIVWIK